MRWLIAASSVLILGCPSDLLAPDGGLICTGVFVYGVTLTVQDGAGDPVAGATVTLTSGRFSETMMEQWPGEYVGAGERAGTYSLRIEADGFASETLTDIVVDEDECHVIPVALQVTLVAG